MQIEIYVLLLLNIFVKKIEILINIIVKTIINNVNLVKIKQVNAKLVLVLQEHIIRVVYVKIVIMTQI